MDHSNNRTTLLGLVAVVVLVLGMAFSAEAAASNIECGLADDVAFVGSVKTVPFITSSMGGTSNSPPHQMTNDVWFKVQSPCTDSIQFNLCDSQFDTIIAVYSGTACGANNTVDASQLLSVNDDSRVCGATSHRSYLSISTRYGDKLYIRIGGFNGEQGTGNLKISCAGTNIALEDDIVSINIEDGGVIEKYLVKPIGWNNLIESLNFSMDTPDGSLALVANGDPVTGFNSISTSGGLPYHHGTVNWTAVSTLNTTNHKYQVSFSISSIGVTIPKTWQLVASLSLNSYQPSNELYINSGSSEIVLWQNTGFYFGYQLGSGHSAFNSSTVSSPSSEYTPSLYIVDDSIFNLPYVYTGYEALRASLSVNLTTKSETSCSFGFYIAPLPIVGDETYTLMSNTNITIGSESGGLLANDLAFRSKKLTAQFLNFENEDPTSHGSIAIYSNGTFFYQPAQDFVGNDIVHYLVIGDGATERGVGTITFVVTPAPVPQANNDTYMAKQNQTLTVNSTIGLLANDTPADITILNNTLPTNGTLVLNKDGSFTYTPKDLFVGNETIAYTVQATMGLKVATGYLTILVLPTLPVTTPDNYTVLQGSTLYVKTNASVLLNDTDPNNLALTAVVRSDDIISGLNFSSDGTFIYTPAVQFSGVVNFTYWAVNSDGLSTQSVVTITVVSVIPVAYNDSISVNQGSSASGILRSDSADYIVVIDGPFYNAYFSYNKIGEFTYTSSQSYSGSDYIDFVAFTNDGRNSSVGRLNITVLDVNFAPVALNDFYSVHQSLPLKIWLNTPLLNDTDADGDNLTFVVVDKPSNGNLTSLPNGTFVYTPSSAFLGQDYFTYQAFDNFLYSNIATVTINVTESHEFPVVQNEDYTTSEDTLLVVNLTNSVLSNDYDPDGHSLIAFLVTPPSHATSFQFYSNGTFVYLPKSNYNGYDSFSYNVSNEHVNVTGQVRIYISPVNDLPHARNDAYTTTQNKVLYVPARGVLINDTDPDQLHDLTVLDFVAPSHGRVAMHFNGSFEYTPNEDFVGVDTFEYIVKDSSDATARAVVSITVEKAGGATVIIIIIVIVLCVIAGALYFLKKRREAQVRGDDPQRLFS